MEIEKLWVRCKKYSDSEKIDVNSKEMLIAKSIDV